LKFLKILTKLLIFIVGALISLWILAPWGKIGEYAVLSAENVARARNLTAQHTSVDGSWIGPKVRINNFSAKANFGGGGEFTTIDLSPSYFKSVFQFSPVALVSFTGGKLVGLIDADMGSGNFEISLKNSILYIRNLKSQGELSFDGFIEINIRDFTIENADLVIRNPERIEMPLNAMKGMVPSLVQENPGQWRIKKEKSNE